MENTNVKDELASVYNENKLNVISSQIKTENSAYDKITGNYWYNNKKLWFFLRSFSLIIIILIFLGLIFNYNYNGVSTSDIFWFLLIPIMVLIIFFIPMFWRNFCPLSTVHLFNFNFFHKKKLSKEGAKANIVINETKQIIYKFLTRNGVVISAILFWLIVPARLWLFNSNNNATLILLVIIFSTAFIMGFLFPVKSGWCTSICPVFSAEKTYGINPAFYVRNQRCDYYNEQQGKINSCSACSFNCIDVNEPEACYFMETCSKPFHDVLNASIRKIFISTLPGFILGYMVLTTGFIMLMNMFGFELLFWSKYINSITSFKIYSWVFFFMLMTFLLYNLIKYLFRKLIIKKEGELTLEKPSRIYSLYKRRLDLSYVAFSFILFWLGNSYAISNYIFGRLFNLEFIITLSLFIILFLLVFILIIIWLYKGWNETFITGEHNPGWW